MYSFLYNIGLLKIIDIILTKLKNFYLSTHFFIQKKKLEKNGSIFGNNCFVDPTVRIDIQGNSRIVIGNNVKILNDSWLITEDNDELIIGDNTFISQNVVISGNVKIGSNVLIAGYVSIIDANHNFDDITKNINEQGGNKLPIVIGNDVWIGTHSIILQGVKIGDHSIIGANTTITKDIEPYSVVIGPKAEVIKRRV